MSAPVRKKLGEIFVEQGVLSAKTRDRVLQRAHQLKRRFGTVLEDLGLITGEELAAALAAQHGLRTISNPARLAPAPELLELLPVEVAMDNFIFPLKREGEKLAIAIADPTDMRIVQNLAADTRLQIVPFVSSRQEIRAAISRHYLGQQAETSPGKRTVMIIDDDKLSLNIHMDALKGDDYRLVTAKDGMEAFKMVVASSPHVIVTDLEMPKLDGYGLLHAIQGIPETRHIPVIMVTGKPRSEQEELKAFEKGFFDVLRKPVNPASLQARVKRAFHFYDYQYRMF